MKSRIAKIIGGISNYLRILSVNQVDRGMTDPNIPYAHVDPDGRSDEAVEPHGRLARSPLSRRSDK